MSIKAEVARLRAMVPEPAWTDPGFIIVVAVRQILDGISERRSNEISERRPMTSGGDQPYPGPFHPDGRPITMEDIRAFHEERGLPLPETLVTFLDIARKADARKVDDDAP